MKKWHWFLILAAFLFAVASGSLAQPPVMSVKITSPGWGSQYAKCSEVVITVDPQIQGGEIKSVALIRNSVGVTAKTKAPWEFKFKNYPPGYYVFVARLTAKTGEIVYSDPVAIIVGNADKGNILCNGEFDCSTSPWQLGQNEGATATFTIDTSAWISTGAAAVVTMENGGTATWHVQLQQPFAVDSGHTYILSFTAQSTENTKAIDIVFQQNADPWTVYNQVSPTIEALQDYGPFVWECNVTDPGAYIRFNIGFTNNTIFWLDNVKVFDMSLTGVKDRSPLNAAGQPVRALISQNYPNPFNPGTTIQYRLPEEADVTLTLYNLRGQAVRTLVHENQKPGEHLTAWNGENEAGERVPSGVYVYRLMAKAADRTYTLSRKIMMLE